MTTFTIRDGSSRVSTEYGEVILDETNGRDWHVNPADEVVLKAVEHGGDAERAAESLVLEFGIDHSTAQRDSEKLLGQLRKLGVLL